MNCDTCGGVGVTALYPDYMVRQMEQYERDHPGVIICGTSLPHDLVACGDCEYGEAEREAAEANA